MSKQDRISILRLRFAALAFSAVAHSRASTQDNGAPFRPVARQTVMAARGSDSFALSPSERCTLARETAPFRAFRADVAALPLRLMAAPFFVS